MRNPFLSAALMVTTLVLLGCGDEASSPGHDDDHHDAQGDHHEEEAPETFAAAVEELTTMRDTVKEAFAADDMQKADGPVHEIGHVLEHLVELAEKAGLSEEQQETVKAAQETLYSTFGALDKTIHGKESGKSWDDVGTDVDQAISNLEELVPATEQEGSTP